MSPILIRKAELFHLKTIARMICSLEQELWPNDHKEFKLKSVVDFLQKTLEDNCMHYCAFVALLDSEIVGVITVCEKAAIYALGNIGEIMEMYILPTFRSRGIGRHLMDAVLEYGRQRGWTIIEVGAPHQPEWARTLEFYKRSGFREIGPRLEMDLDKLSRFGQYAPNKRFSGYKRQVLRAISHMYWAVTDYRTGDAIP